MGRALRVRLRVYEDKVSRPGCWVGGGFRQRA